LHVVGFVSHWSHCTVGEPDGVGSPVFGCSQTVLIFLFLLVYALRCLFLLGSPSLLAAKDSFASCSPFYPFYGTFAQAAAIEVVSDGVELIEFM